MALNETASTSGNKQIYTDITESIGEMFVVDGNALKQCLIYNPIKREMPFVINNNVSTVFDTLSQSSAVVDGTTNVTTSFDTTSNRGATFDPSEYKEVQLDY